MNANNPPIPVQVPEHVPIPMAPNPKYSAVRPAGREHVPIYPKGFIALRIVQLVLAVLILALAAYGCAVLPTSGNIYMAVVCLFTIGIEIYYLVVHYSVPRSYNYWAVLGLEIFMVIMWLASFALLASEAAIVMALLDYTYSFSYYYFDEGAVGACMATAAALGGIVFLLFITSLAIHGVRLHWHRAAGLHCKPGVPPTLPAPATTPGGEKIQSYLQTYPQPQAYPPQAYAPQAYPPQAYPPQAYPPQGYMPQAYQVAAGIPQGQQQLPQGYAYPAPTQQGQVPIPIQSTGGSYGQVPPSVQQPVGYYQQGPPVQLLPQTTGGSTVQSPPQQPQAQPPQPTGGSELENNQVQQQQQQQQQQPLPLAQPAAAPQQ
ncbi:hypothetical protein B0T16DRAFT_452112 [Cercophora newfieldiana]|uniref:MARVEL domain-containing protein n=1 Tax=Cercophora newfieldiana TaxID=92897 RepID=A0AA40CYX1_9PEZI|nr:hypothetical protein B0T16DRAFT_452112 [Cercophora newfieldiana]